MKAKNLTVCILIALIAMIPSVALAGKGVLLTIANNTGKNITITPGYANCFYANDLGVITQQPPGEKVYYTERQEGGSCFFANNNDNDIRFTITTQDGGVYSVKLYLKDELTISKRNRQGYKTTVEGRNLLMDITPKLLYEAGRCGDQCRGKIYVQSN